MKCEGGEEGDIMGMERGGLCCPWEAAGGRRAIGIVWGRGGSDGGV